MNADLHWCHLFRDLFGSGEFKRMSAATMAVYFCVKSYVGLSTGESRLSIEFISDKTGIGVRQVRRHLAKLRDAGYVDIIARAGETNAYKIRERIETGEHVASWHYVPSEVASTVKQLRGTLMDKDTSAPVNVHIEIREVKEMNNNVNLALGEELSKLSPELQELFRRAISSAQRPDDETQEPETH